MQERISDFQRSSHPVLIAEDSFLILRNLAELVILILELKLGKLYLIDDLLALLSVYQDVVKFSFTRNFVIGSILSRVKPH